MALENVRPETIKIMMQFLKSSKQPLCFRCFFFPYPDPRRRLFLQEALPDHHFTHPYSRRWICVPLLGAPTNLVINPATALVTLSRCHLFILHRWHQARRRLRGRQCHRHHLAVLTHSASIS